MSKKLLLIASCALLLLASGCKKDPEKEPDTFAGSVARSVWTPADSEDLTSSMTAVVKVDLKAQFPDKAADFVLKDDDLLAAFIGETCLGVAQPQEGLFFLFVAAPATDTPSPVTLKYYSRHYSNLFVAADAFPFVNDSHLGTVASPFVPLFQESR